MNIPVPPPLGSFFLVAVVVSWSWSTLIESLTWKGSLEKQIGSVKYLSILGWMALLQAVSTPLSYGCAMLAYGISFQLQPLSYLDVMFWSRSFLQNPIGVVIGFLLIPIILEFLIWRNVVERAQSSPTKSVSHFSSAITPRTISFNVILANSLTFLLGVGFTFLENWSAYSISPFSYLGLFNAVAFVIILLILLIHKNPGSSKHKEGWERSFEREGGGT